MVDQLVAPRHLNSATGPTQPAADLASRSAKRRGVAPRVAVGGFLLLWAIVIVGHVPTVLVAGRAGIEPWTALSVFAQTFLMLAVLYEAWGARRAAATFILVVLLAWAVECFGSQTGVPFGRYSHTDVLQPQVGGVPALVALAWFIMLPPAWAIAAMITGRGKGVWFCLTAGIALAAWDLFVDPQAVAWGWWMWTTGGSYFGIPLSNYIGWMLSGALITAAVRPKPLPAGPLLVVYGGIWLAYSVGLGCLHGLPGPAVAGFVGMGGMLLLACLRGWRRQVPHIQC